MEHLSPFSKPKYKYYPSNPRASTKLMQVRFSHAACCKQKKLLNIIAFGPNWEKWFLTACHKQVRLYHNGACQTYVENKHTCLKNQANIKCLLHSNTLECLYSVSDLNCLTFEPALNLKSMYSIETRILWNKDQFIIYALWTLMQLIQPVFHLL